MAITLSNLHAVPGAKKTKRRVGRGLGSRGTTAGRGQKGQSSRSGVGGLKRLGMRHTILATPKLRGFTSLAKKAYSINVGSLDKMYLVNEVVSPRTLMNKGLIQSQDKKVKILGNGELSHAVTVKGCAVSEAAAAKITAVGGKIEA